MIDKKYLAFSQFSIVFRCTLCCLIIVLSQNELWTRPQNDILNQSCKKRFLLLNDDLIELMLQLFGGTWQTCRSCTGKVRLGTDSPIFFHLNLAEKKKSPKLLKALFECCQRRKSNCELPLSHKNNRLKNQKRKGEGNSNLQLQSENQFCSDERERKGDCSEQRSD